MYKLILVLLCLIALPSRAANRRLLLDSLQHAAMRYMWDGAEPNSGMALERIHVDGSMSEADHYIVTTGGTGFGLCGLIVGMERGWISRRAGVERIAKIVDFLTRADRFHGMWPHWLDGRTGSVKPFSSKDDGGDVVESAFLMQGLLCVRQYLQADKPREVAIIGQINALWESMEFDWYTRGQDESLYWHWSPRHDWAMNLPIRGYNECLMAYLLGLASPTHAISAECYEKGWCSGDAESTNGPLFWAHYSWIGLDPCAYRDGHADYRKVVYGHARRNFDYCLSNPKGYAGYGRNCWGLTASYSPDGYAGHCPGDDRGVITPTAALSSMPYLPKQSKRMLQFLWNHREQLWGEYGPYDAFTSDLQWRPARYLAIDQLTIAPMIENYRTGLLWRLFMSCPEIRQLVDKIAH